MEVKQSEESLQSPASQRLREFLQGRGQAWQQVRQSLSSLSGSCMSMSGIWNGNA